MLGLAYSDSDEEGGSAPSPSSSGAKRVRLSSGTEIPEPPSSVTKDDAFGLVQKRLGRSLFVQSGSWYSRVEKRHIHMPHLNVVADTSSPASFGTPAEELQPRSSDDDDDEPMRRRRSHADPHADETWHSPEHDIEPPPPPRHTTTTGHTDSPASPFMHSTSNTPLKIAHIPAAPHKVASALALVSYSVDDEPEALDGDRRGKRVSNGVVQSGLCIRDDSIADNLNTTTTRSTFVSAPRKRSYSEEEFEAQAVDEMMNEVRALGSVAPTSMQRLAAATKSDDTPQSAAGSDSPADLEAPMDSVSQDVTIPPPPDEQCNEQLLKRFENYFAQKARGYNFNANIQNRKDFRNPSIYEKLIEHFNLDERGTNFPKEVFDPHGWTENDEYDKLAENQKLLMDRIDREKTTQKQRPSSHAAEATSTAKKSSKWEQTSSKK